jgi:hypothetical protein
MIRFRFNGLVLHFKHDCTHTATQIIDVKKDIMASFLWPDEMQTYI